MSEARFTPSGAAVKVLVARPVHARLSERRRRLQDAAGRQVTMSEAIERALDCLDRADEAGQVTP